MATAKQHYTTKTRTVEYQEADGVTLHLTQEEAQTLRGLLGFGPALPDVHSALMPYTKLETYGIEHYINWGAITHAYRRISAK